MLDALILSYYGASRAWFNFLSGPSWGPLLICLLRLTGLGKAWIQFPIPSGEGEVYWNIGTLENCT